MTNKVPFRMSSAGACPKAVVAERLGHKAAPVPDWVKKAGEEGKWHEKRIRDQLKTEGYEVEECEECPICKQKYGRIRNGIHIEYETELWIATGHLDCRLRKNGLKQGGEIKSRSQFEYARWMTEGFAGFPDEAAQIAIYMEADPQESWLYITKNRSSGYDDRRILTESPLPFSKVKENLDLAAKFINLRTLPEIDYNPNDIQCRRCGFTHLCVPEVKKLELIKLADLQSAAAEFRKGDAMVKKGQALVAIAKQAFEEHSKASGEDRWSFDGLNICYVHVKGRETYNSKVLAEIFTKEQLEPATEFKSPYDFIRVDDKRENEEETGDATLRE